MDITRHWRGKYSRSHLLATRDRETGAFIIPQNASCLSRNGNEPKTYNFNKEDDLMSNLNPELALKGERAVR